MRKYFFTRLFSINNFIYILEFNEICRIGLALLSKIMGANRNKGYDAGHIIPAFLFGSDEEKNLFCQNSEVIANYSYVLKFFDSVQQSNGQEI